MELVPIIVLAVIGAVGVCLMLVAFVMVSLRGGWQQAMQSAEGRWTAPRLLMLSGAILGVAFAALLFVPGMVPWWDYSSPNQAWGLGVVFGLCLGFASGTVYWQTILARQKARGTAERVQQG